MKINKEDSVLLVKTWDSFVQSIREKNYATMKRTSLEKVYCLDVWHIWPGLSSQQYVPIDSFINSVLIKFYNEHMVAVLTDSTCRIMATTFPDWRPSNVTLTKKEQLTLYDVYFIDYVPVTKRIKNENFYVFRFVKEEGQFKFFGLNLDWP